MLPIVVMDSGLNPAGCPGMTERDDECDRFNFQTAKARSSLRANGSRKCAPDDKLHEAIHGAS